MESPLDTLVRALSRLPGLGRRSAERAALALVRDPDGALDALQRALSEARESVLCCDVCGGFTTKDANPCRICADALRELCDYMGVDNIITFDAHDARVQNAIPLHGFENVFTTYQMIKAMVKNVPDLKIDKDHMMVISPDEGGMSRCIYYSTVLGLDIGMFYKRRDYSVVVNGRNPIVAHEFLGTNVEGKDVIIVDDMISSGDSMIEVARKLKDLHANRIFIFTAFGLFCNGLDVFDNAYETRMIDRVFTTNLIYRTPALLEREWYTEVDLSKYISLIVETLNHDESMSGLLDPADRINDLLHRYGYR